MKKKSWIQEEFSFVTRRPESAKEQRDQNKRAIRLVGAEFSQKVAEQSAMYVSVFLESIGFTAAQTGLVNSVNNFVGIFASPTWGIISDKIRSLKKILLICFICDALLFAFIPQSAETILWGLPLVFILLPIVNFFKRPGQSMVENWVVRESNEHHLNFGLIRAFGSFSYAIMGIVLGIVLPLIGGARATFYIYPIALLPVIIICLTIKEKHHANDNKKSLKFSEMGFGKLFKNYYYITYMMFTVILRFPTSCVVSFMNYLLTDIHVDPTAVGFILGTCAFVEIPVLMLFRRISHKIPLQYLILASAACLGTQMLLLRFATELWHVVVIMGVFQGVGQGLNLAAGPNFIYQLAPENLKATAQTLNGATVSIAGIAGAAIGGILITNIGAGQFYFYAGLVVMAAILLYFGSLIFGKQVLKLPAPGTFEA